MGIVGYDLSHYPLREHYKACQQYEQSLPDWREIRDAIIEKGTVGIDVSDAISLFSHLELDSEYRLISYMSLGYHGFFGKIVAVKKCDDWHPGNDVNNARQEFLSSGFFNELHIPECVFPPMEAIFHDGSAEGYYEAVLCASFLHALPNNCTGQNPLLTIMDSPPNDYETRWDYPVALADWRPRYTECAIIALHRKYESGIGSSDGKDRIYLSRFSFYRSVNESALFSVIKKQKPDSSNHIKDNNRYSETKKCCVFSKSSVLVAEERL